MPAKIFSFFFFSVPLLFFLTLSPLWAQEGAGGELGASYVVKEIQVNASEKAKKTVLRSIDFQAGDVVSAKKLRETFKSIYGLKLFEKLDFELQDAGNNEKILVINTLELLRIGRVRFSGNKKFSDVYLREEVLTKEGQAFRPHLINESINKITSYYTIEGYLYPSIIANASVNEKDRTVSIQYTVTEGFQVLVGTIRFHGNKALTEKELKKGIYTKETAWYKNHSFDLSNVEKDKEAIPYLYKRVGHLDAKVLDVKYSYRWQNPKKKDKQMVDIDFTVEEGGPAYFGNVFVKGNRIYNEKDLLLLMGDHRGSLFNQEIHDRGVQAIRELYQNNGYIFSSVSDIPRFYENGEGQKIVDHTLEIYEGRKAHIEKIFIQGNSKTKDFVIRRELLFREGEIFNRAKIQRSMERLFNLQYFKNVVPEPRPGSVEGLMNLVINMEEKSTMKLAGGGGYDFDQGLFLRGTFEDINFLGRGYTFGTIVEAGFNRQMLNVYFTNPYIGDIPLSIQSNIMFRFADLALPTGRRTSYAIDKDTREPIGKKYDAYYSIPIDGRHGKSTTSILYKNFDFSTGVQVDYQFFDYFSVGTGLSYTLSRKYWDDVITITPSFKRAETQKATWEKHKDQFDVALPQNVINSIEIPFSFGMNSLDNYIFPTRGFKGGVSATLLTVDYQAVKWKFEGNYYQKLGMDRFVLGFHARIESLGSLFGMKIKYDPSYYYTFNFEDLKGWNQEDLLASRQMILNYDKTYKTSDLLSYGNPWGQSKVKFGLDFNISLLPNILSFTFATEMGNLYAQPLSTQKAWNFMFNPKYFMYSFGPGLGLDIASFPIQFFLSWRTVWDPATRRFIFLNHKGNSKAGYAPEFVFSIKGFF